MKKRLISLLLVLAMIVSTVPCTCFADSGKASILLEVCVNETSVKKEPYQDSQTLAKVSRGSILFSTGSTTNKYDNLWYQIVCIDPDSGNKITGWVFNEKAYKHEHSYSSIDTDTNAEISYCRCGSIKYKDADSMKQTAFVDALYPEDIGALEAAAALEALGVAIKAKAAAAGAAVSAGLAAATPCLIVVGIGGAVIYLATNVTLASVEVSDAAPDWKRLDAKYKPDEGVYYKGCIQENSFCVDVANPLDANKAEKYISICMNLWSPSNKFNWFIYTLTPRDAEYVVGEIIDHNIQFEATFVPEGHAKGNLMKQFNHYHITKEYDPSHRGSHVLFGAPRLGEYSKGVWA